MIRPLSRRQREVLLLIVVRGMTVSQIARQLGVAVNTACCYRDLGKAKLSSEQEQIINRAEWFARNSMRQNVKEEA